MAYEKSWMSGLSVLAMTLLPAIASADVAPWRAGEPRSVGIGSCAKGPCLRRYDFSPSKPHLHVGGKRIFNDYGAHARPVVPRDGGRLACHHKKASHRP